MAHSLITSYPYVFTQALKTGSLGAQRECTALFASVSLKLDV